MQTKSQMRVREGGFTLIELMVVVAIIGVTATLGLVYIDSDQTGKNAQRYAEGLGAQYELARARAVATQRRQRIVIEPDNYAHYESVVEGLAAVADPGDYANWTFVRQVMAPRGVRIAATDGSLHLEAADSVPPINTSLLTEIDVLPDGRARSSSPSSFFESGWTVFISDNKKEVRTLLFGVTGASATYNDW